MAIYPRIAGRLGNIVDLNMRFLHNGSPSEPYAIRRVDIYRGFIRRDKLVEQITFPDVNDTSYPLPAIQDSTDVSQFSLMYDASSDLVPNDVYLDVWHFLGSDPGSAGLDDESLWVSKFGSFYLFDDVWLADADLQTIKFGFFPQDKLIRRGEIRTIEVSIYPVPRHNYNHNLIVPLIHNLDPTITVYTTFGELIGGLVDAPCSIGLKQGAGRDCPYVIQCQIDARTLLRGTYKYFIKLAIGNTIIVSEYFYFTVQ